MRYLLRAMLIALLLTGCGSSVQPDQSLPLTSPEVPLPGPAWSHLVPATRSAASSPALDTSALTDGWAVAASLGSDQTITLHYPRFLNGTWVVESPAPSGSAGPQAIEWLRYQPPSATPISETGATVSRSRLGRDAYLVHGLLSNGQAVRELADWLRNLGLYDRVIVCTYQDERPVTGSAADLAEAVRTHTSKDRGCDLIAHSLGGLVSRWAVEQLGLSDRVRTVWMLGTPHVGSSLAGTAVRLPLEEWLDGSATAVALSFAVNAEGHLAVLQDLAPNSDFIRQLSWGPRVVGAKYDYLTIGGDLIVKGRRTYTDGVVSLANANWSGLGLHARSHTGAIVPVSHGGLIRDERSFKQLAAMMKVRANQS